MKSNQICEVLPYMFNDNIIISLSKDWITVFDGIPKFVALIDDNGRLVNNLKDPASKRRIRLLNQKFSLRVRLW